MVGQHLYSALDCLTLCQFVYGSAWQLYGPTDIVKLVQTVTGWEDVTMEEILKVGERRVNMMRAFNARDGFDRKDDLIPQKLFQPLKGGASDGWALDRAEVDAAMNKYYELCGWDADTGNPNRAKLEELDLAWVADQLGL